VNKDTPSAAAVKPDLATKEQAIVGTLLAEFAAELPPHCARTAA
jgi:hypothetical protein